MLDRAGRFWRTVRHLKPIQIYGRLWFRMARPKPNLNQAPPTRKTGGRWIAPARRNPSMTGAEAFRFLNEEGDLAQGWNTTERAKLWLYNLHYFDDLNATDSASRRAWHIALIDRWILENPPGQGNGWEPYPASLRIVNWVKWALSGNQLSDAAQHSLAVQARWLMRRLEWHILGNHLFANAKALIFAGLYFEGQEAELWLAKGMAILSTELPEQILADGGQFELSPMYHALAVEDALDLINLAQAHPGKLTDLEKDCSARLPSMLHWLRTMCHPDGQISFFNDAAIGIAPSPAELEGYAQRLCVAADYREAGGTHLERSGYVRMVLEKAVLIADVARLGPDYLPGHGHADTLSFELSLDDLRLIVNRGTSVYGISAQRVEQRGTAAHNSIVLDGQNSSEVWSGFRVGRRAKPVVERFDGTTLIASHDGYSHLPGNPRHRRSWLLDAEKLILTDEVTGAGQHAVDLYLHFAPGIRLQHGEDGEAFIINDESSGRSCTLALSGQAQAKVEASYWHPEFGLEVPATKLHILWSGELPFRHECVLTWGEQ